MKNRAKQKRKKKTFLHICYLPLINVDRNETLSVPNIVFLLSFSFAVRKNTMKNNVEGKNCVHFQKPIIISSNEIMMKVTGRSFYLASGAAVFSFSQSYDFF